jgi:flagellar biosynthesis protein FlhF
MREALEKVKAELGDEALVLSSKSIRKGGILGMGARNQIEVTVSTDSAIGEPLFNNDDNRLARSRSNFTTLSLNNAAPYEQILSPKPDSTHAREEPAWNAARNAGSAFSALAARAYSTEANSVAASTSDGRGSTAIVLERTRTREVETRDSARTPVLQETKSALDKLDSSVPASTVKRDPVTVELDRLRAEIREVKFTLGTLAGHSRDTAQPPPGFSEADAQLYDSPFYETYLALGTLGLPPDLAKAVTRAAIAAAPDTRDTQELMRIGLMKALPLLVTFGADRLAKAAIMGSGQPVVALIGPTGVGKTTTIAKLAARIALKEQRRVELITLDTYRIAAVDQLKTYAEIIGAGFHVPRSILELDVLIRRYSGEATIMIDTIGRSAQDLSDQMELADYLRDNEQITKCLVIQATTQPADVQVAISKFALFGVNSLVITKLDETCRAGASVATAAGAGLPLVYLCNGQRVPEDIEIATAESLTACILRTNNALAMAA